MKLIISTLLFSFCSKANHIAIYDVSEKGLGIKVEKIFIEKKAVPQQLISVYRAKVCPHKLKVKNVLGLCITKKEELVVLNTNSYIIDSLKVFRKEVE